MFCIVCALFYLVDRIEKMTYNGPNGIYKNGSPDRKRPGRFLANVMSKV